MALLVAALWLSALPASIGVTASHDLVALSAGEHATMSAAVHRHAHDEPDTDAANAPFPTLHHQHT